MAAGLRQVLEENQKEDWSKLTAADCATSAGQHGKDQNGENGAFHRKLVVMQRVQFLAASAEHRKRIHYSYARVTVTLGEQEPPGLSSR